MQACYTSFEPFSCEHASLATVECDRTLARSFSFLRCDLDDHHVDALLVWSLACKKMGSQMIRDFLLALYLSCSIRDVASREFDASHAHASLQLAFSRLLPAEMIGSPDPRLLCLPSV